MRFLSWFRRKPVNEKEPKDLREAMIEVLFAAESKLPKRKAYDPIDPRHKRLTIACQMVSQHIDHGMRKK